jgi:ABC-type transport system substrate-binding protein
LPPEIMRFIALRWLVASKGGVALLTVLVCAQASFGSTKPRYGGTLHVEFLAQSISFDPRTWKPGSREFGTNERLAALMFDRLVSVDSYGRFVGQLATEWSHDASARRWQFTLRAGVKFSDGVTLTAADAAAAFVPLLPEGVQVSASAGNLVFQCAEPRPDLLELLASGRFFIFRAHDDGTLRGTGPFTLDITAKTEKPAGNELAAAALAPTVFHFTANENCWAGRPFLDKIEISFGIPPLRALFDLQAGRADLVELAPDVVRRANQSNVRVWASLPVTLYFLRFEDAQPQAANTQLREALTLSLDRATMAGVLLQKQAEPAAALLPQWLSGYAFLFRAETDFERARQLRAALPPNVAGGNSPLRLQMDILGDLARLLSERVAVNARQTGIAVQSFSKAVAHDAGTHALESADLHLFAWRYSTLSPEEELRGLVKAAHAEEDVEGKLRDADRRYAEEKRILEERKVMPLVAVPDYAALAANVRDWQPSSWGEWRLADVWLEPPSVQKNEAAGNTTPGVRP